MSTNQLHSCHSSQLLTKVTTILFSKTCCLFKSTHVWYNFTLHSYDKSSCITNATCCKPKGYAFFSLTELISLGSFVCFHLCRCSCYSIHKYSVTVLALVRAQ